MISHGLRVFLKVAERGSITETASELYISQPAVSKAIRNLEEDLGVRLFHRDKRKGLVLTCAGKQIAYYARQMQEMENHIKQIGFQQNNILGGSLKVASFPVMTGTVLSRVIARFRKEYPKVDLELVDRDPQTVQSLVEQHAVDFGISASPFLNVRHDTLVHDRIVAVYKNKQKPGTEVDLYGDTHSLVFCEAGRETVMEVLKDASRIRFSDSLIVQNHETIIQMVEEGNGTGIISEYTLDSIPNSLFRYEVKPSIEIEIALVAVDFRDLTPIAVQFIQMVKDEIDYQYSRRK